mmetsp:Transcript_10846/g.20087  ORF Transcript_10846/g.20087 Transcript_10846/m.20087 type:complete len:276 (-) Transcript_10846:35-862(-)
MADFDVGLDDQGAQHHDSQEQEREHLESRDAKQPLDSDHSSINRLSRRRSQNKEAARRARKKARVRVERLHDAYMRSKNNERRALLLLKEVKDFLFESHITTPKFPSLRQIENMVFRYEQENGQGSLTEHLDEDRYYDPQEDFPRMSRGFRQLDSVNSSSEPHKIFGDMPNLSGHNVRNYVDDSDEKSVEKFGDLPSISIEAQRRLGIGGAQRQQNPNPPNVNLYHESPTLGPGFGSLPGSAPVGSAMPRTIEKQLQEMECRITGHLISIENRIR